MRRSAVRCSATTTRCCRSPSPPTAACWRAETTEVWALAFDPVSGRLAAGGRGGVTLWNLGSDALLAGACRLAGRNLSDAEWRRYLGSEPYRALCPGLPLGV